MKVFKFKFKEGAKVNTTEEFWYALTDGGYIKPEDLLDDPKQIKALDAAIRRIKAFEQALFDNRIMVGEEE